MFPAGLTANCSKCPNRIYLVNQLYSSQSTGAPVNASTANL